MFDFFCSAVGCVTIVRNVQVFSRTKNSERCKPCGGKKVPPCLDKHLFVIPVDIHDELAVLSNNSEQFDAVMEKIRQLEVYRESLDAGIEFWAQLYLKQDKKTKKGPTVTITTEEMEDDDAVNVSIDDLSSASEMGGPVYHGGQQCQRPEPANDFKAPEPLPNRATSTQDMQPNLDTTDTGSVFSLSSQTLQKNNETINVVFSQNNASISSYGQCTLQLIQKVASENKDLSKALELSMIMDLSEPRRMQVLQHRAELETQS